MNFDLSTVKAHSIFSNLNRSEIEHIFKDFEIKQFSKKSKICKQGDPYDHIHFIINGFSKLYFENEKYNIILTLASPGEFIGLLYMFSQEKYPYTVECLSKKDNLVLALKKKNFINVCMKNPKFLMELSARGNQRAYDMVTILLTMNRKHVRGRLAAILLYFADNVFKSTKFELPFTRLDIANLANISNENTVRLLSEFSSDKLINLNNKKVEILDRAKLEEIAMKG